MKRGIGAAALCVGLVMGSLAISTPASAEVEISRTSAPGVSQGARIDPTTGIVYALAQYVLNSSGTGVDSRLYAVEDGVLVGDLSIPYAAVSFDIDPTTQRAYIITSQYPTYTLRVVDLTTMSVVSSTTLPGQSVDIDADPDTGRVAVTVLAGNVLVFDGPTMGQIANVPLSGQPFRLAFSEGADKLYVTRPSASTVALSGASYATIESLPASGGQSLVLDHEADVLYMSSQNNAPNGGLFKVDLSTNTLIAHNPSPPWGQYTGWITLTDGGETLIGPDRNGYLAEVDTSTLAQIGVIGPQYLYNAYGDLSSGRLVALLDGGCCINTGEVVEFAPTDPPAVLPTASATTSTVIEGDPEDDYPWGSDDTETFVTVELDQASTEWARVTVEYTAGTATYGSGGDYYSNYPVDAYFAPGETEAQARLVLRADEVQEVTETLSFSVVDALGATVDATPAVVTVLDDDGPRASIVPLEPVGVEGDGLLDFAIELDVASESEVTVDWSVSEGSATFGDDFDGAGGQAVFEAGETLVSQSVVLVDDVLVEGDETFSIELTGGSGVEVDDDVALATIVDDDEAPPPVPVASIQPVDPSALESDGSLEFFVELDVPSDDEVTVDWSATAGTAGAGSDFDGAGGTAVFAPGETLMAQSVVINDDAVAEPDESFTISLTSADGATVDGVDVVATIIDDDTPPSVVSAGANVSVVEGADGTSRVARVRVLFNPPTSSEVDVSWAASGITAVESDDYLISGDTLTVPAGTALAEVEVEVLGDALDEPNETLGCRDPGRVGQCRVGWRCHGAGDDHRRRRGAENHCRRRVGAARVTRSSSRCRCRVRVGGR